MDKIQTKTGRKIPLIKLIKKEDVDTSVIEMQEEDLVAEVDYTWFSKPDDEQQAPIDIRHGGPFRRKAFVLNKKDYTWIHGEDQSGTEILVPIPKNKQS